MEIRLQIYGYTDLVGHTIEVLNLPILQTSQGTQCYRIYNSSPIDHELVYRLERHNDEPYREVQPTSKSYSQSHFPAPPGVHVCRMPRPGRLGRSTEPIKRKRCFSAHGLFSLTSVCRQVRAETHLLVYERNSFAFSDGNYNYSSAIRAFTETLDERELSSIHTIYWPMINALLYQRSIHGENIDEPDRACVEESRALKGLKRVVLRYIGSDIHNVTNKASEYEAKELKAIFAERGRWDYLVETEFRITLAIRGMKALLGSEDVEIVCDKTWRAAF